MKGRGGVNERKKGRGGEAQGYTNEEQTTVYPLALTRVFVWMRLRRRKRKRTKEKGKEGREI